MVLHGLRTLNGPYPSPLPGAYPLIGTGGRIGQRFGIAASIDRAPEFTLMRAGFFVGW